MTNPLRIRPGFSTAAQFGKGFDCLVQINEDGTGSKLELTPQVLVQLAASWNAAQGLSQLVETLSVIAEPHMTRPQREHVLSDAEISVEIFKDEMAGEL